MGHPGELRDEGFAAAEQAASEQRGERQIGPEMLDVVEQRDVLAERRPGPGEQCEDGEAAEGDPQRVAGPPQEHDADRDDRRGGQGGGEIAIGIAGAAEVGEHRPGDDEDDQGKTAQDDGRGQFHFVRWLAMWLASVRSEVKMRTLSWLSERSWKP